MTDLAGEAMLTSVEVAVDDDSTADARADRHVKHGAMPTPAAQRRLPERSGISVVEDNGRK